jgi:preprotein translocase subunit YajC
VGGFGFVILIVIFGLVWFLLLMPARRRRMAHMAMQDSIEVGDEIITAGGLHAEVTAIDGDLVWIEIASGVVARLDRRAVAAVAREIEVEAENGVEPPSEDLPPAS